MKGKGGKKVTRSKRFVSPTSSVEMDKICKGFVPKYMEKATNWAVRVFKQWRVERIEQSDKESYTVSASLTADKII